MARPSRSARAIARARARARARASRPTRARLGLWLGLVGPLGLGLVGVARLEPG